LSRAFTNAKQTRHYVEAIQVEKIQPILNVLDFCSQGTEGKWLNECLKVFVEHDMERKVP
jgi:hypothetical protein